MTLSWRLLAILITVVIFVWLLTMAVHNANAEEETAAPKWMIVVILDGPPGKQELVFGNSKDGVHWFKDKDVCEASRKGADKEFAKAWAGVKKMQADFKQHGVPIEATSECRLDSSI